ncbi:DUF2807 domain-containing protein [bacterium]|nr:DUF2807 domain-containing protein [candidate division CSSED10-310 bacterium]
MTKIGFTIFLTGCLCAITATTNAISLKGSGNIISEDRDLPEFTNITVKGSTDVTLTQDNKRAVRVTVDDNLISHLQTEVVNGTLEIYFDCSVNTSGNHLVEIVIPVLESIKISGSSDVSGNGTWNCSDLTLAVSGSGDITCDVNADTLTVKISGSGDIILSGNTDEVTCKIAGSGDFKALDLEAKAADISISGSGNVKIHVSEKLNARILGSGDIQYSGNPKIEQRILGSGSITNSN